MIRETPASLTRVVMACVGTAFVAVLPLLILAITRGDAIANSLSAVSVGVGFSATFGVVLVALAGLIASAVWRQRPARI